MIKLYYRVVKYEDDRKVSILFTSRQSADNYIFSHNPPLHAYITIEEEDLESEEVENLQPCDVVKQMKLDI